MSDKLPTTWKSFLETFPLYKKWRIPAEVPSSENPPQATWSLLWKPSLTMLCDAERHEGWGDAHKTRTFNMANNWGDQVARNPDPTGEVFGRVVRTVFACAECGRLFTFLVEFGPEQTSTLLTATTRLPDTPGDEVEVSRAAPPVRPVGSAFPPPPPHEPAKIRTPAWVRKVGQCPPWWPEIPEEVRRALEAVGVKNHDSYKRALASEGESFGVGAFAYYRAIVERILESLAEAKRAALSEDQRKAFDSEWREASRDGSARIALVYDTLPTELRVDGSNPLDYLYSRLSTGLHGGNDETCTEQVGELRETLLEVVMSLQRERERNATAERMREKIKRRTT